MATEKKSSIKNVKLTNSMQQLVAGIVPNSGRNLAQTPNGINYISSLRKQVRHDWITMDYTLLSFLYQQFGLIQALIEVPVLDAFRGGIRFSAYEKKVILPPKQPKRSKWHFWNAKEENQPQSTQNDFLMEMLKKRESWEKEQVKKDE